MHGPGGLSGSWNVIWGALAGVPPNVRPWHPHWCALSGLRCALDAWLPGLGGTVLDVGCGAKPYAGLLTGAGRHLGLDIGPWADIRVDPGQVWPLEDAQIDAVLCTEVIEHVPDLDFVVGEMTRVLRPGGMLVVTAPFVFPLHGLPHDYRRFAPAELERLFAPAFEVVQSRLLGGVGSAVAGLVNSFPFDALAGSTGGRLAKGAMLPLWPVLFGSVNLLAWCADRIDATGRYGTDCLLVARRH